MVHKIGPCFLFHSTARDTEAWSGRVYVLGFVKWFPTRLVALSGIKLDG